jgi:hypothetical protein
MPLINFRIGTDAFENRHDRLTQGMDPSRARETVRKALEFLENQAEDARLNMNHVNNATVTVTRIVGSLSAEVERLRDQLEQIKEIAG